LSTIVTPPLNTAATSTNTDRNGHSARLIDKTYSPRLGWFLSQTISWFATDRNVQRKKSSMPTLVISGGTVKKFTPQLRYNKLFSFSMLKNSGNNSQVIPCLSKFLIDVHFSGKHQRLGFASPYGATVR